MNADSEGLEDVIIYFGHMIHQIMPFIESRLFSGHIESDEKRYILTVSLAAGSCLE